MEVTVKAAALVFFLGATLSVAPLASQELPRPTMAGVDEVTTKPVGPHSADDARDVIERSMVRLRVTPRRSPHLRAIGDPSAWGAGTLVEIGGPEKQVVLLTAEFLVREAQKVEAMIGDKAVELEVLQADVHLGLAALSAPEALRQSLTPMPLTERAPGPTTRLYTVAHEAGGRALGYQAVVEPSRDRALSFYHVARPPLSNGYPLVTQDGQLYGLYAFRPVANPEVGLAIAGEPLREFIRKLAGEATAPGEQVEEVPLEVKGTSTWRRR